MPNNREAGVVVEQLIETFILTSPGKNLTAEVFKLIGVNCSLHSSIVLSVIIIIGTWITLRVSCNHRLKQWPSGQHVWPRPGVPGNSIPCSDKNLVFCNARGRWIRIPPAGSPLLE